MKQGETKLEKEKGQAKIGWIRDWSAKLCSIRHQSLAPNPLYSGSGPGNRREFIPSIYTSLIKKKSFVSFKQIPFCNFFLCPLKFLASPFLLNVKAFLSVYSRLFINLYIVIKSPLSHLSFSVVRCIFLSFFLIR